MAPKKAAAKKSPAKKAPVKKAVTKKSPVTTTSNARPLDLDIGKIVVHCGETGQSARL